MSTQQLLQPWASLVGYNQQPPICLRHSSRCRRPAFCLVGPLVAAGARVARWAVARAGCLGAGARGGGWGEVLLAITPYPLPPPPNCPHCLGRSPAPCLWAPLPCVPLLLRLRVRRVCSAWSAGLVGRSPGRRHLLEIHSIHFIYLHYRGHSLYSLRRWVIESASLESHCP